MSEDKKKRASSKRKEFVKLNVAFSVPITLAERFKKNLEERGFTERGDLSHEINRALHLYLEQVGAFEEDDTTDELSFFVEAEDLD